MIIMIQKSSVNLKKSLVLKKGVKVFLVVVIIILLVINILLIISGFKTSAKKIKELDYSYHLKQNIDYKVPLYHNSFIEKEYLGKNENYISDLVKSIDATFQYQYLSNKQIDLKYYYQIKAIINGEYKLNDDDSSAKVWTKEYVLDSKVEEVKNTDHLNLKPEVIIDYHLYNNTVSEFRKELKLPINASLSVICSIHVTGNTEENEIDDTKEMIMYIPLNNQAFKITEELTTEDSKQFFKEENYIEKSNYFKLITVTVAQVSLGVVAINFIYLLLSINPKTYYQKQKQKYLKTYGDIIVEISTPVKKDNLQVVIVKSFEEMIDLEEELRIPINFYEDKEGKRGQFTIVHNSILYLYVLEEE